MAIQQGPDRSMHKELIERALQAREAAYAPYSEFKVGAALVTADGRIYSGCNVENSTYSLTICAERVAIFKAASDGVRRITAIAIVADSDKPTPPCGCCRQIIWEFGTGQTQVLLANLSGLYEEMSIEELFPNSFDSTFLRRRE